MSELAVTEGRAPSQSLTSADVTKLDLVTTEVGEVYPEKGLQNMIDLDEHVLLNLKTKYSDTISGEKHHTDNVKDVLGLAEKQVNSPDHSLSLTDTSTTLTFTTHTTTYTRTYIP